VLPNWSLNKSGECSRYDFCDPERHRICKAIPVGAVKKGSPYSKKGRKSCPHKYTTTVPTDDKVFIDGEQKRVFEVICKECGDKRRIII